MFGFVLIIDIHVWQFENLTLKNFQNKARGHKAWATSLRLRIFKTEAEVLIKTTNQIEVLFLSMYTRL